MLINGSITPSLSLQYKEVGEPRQKKGKSHHDDGGDDNDDNEEEGPNEEPEDVIFHYRH